MLAMTGQMSILRSPSCAATLCWILLGLTKVVAINAAGTESRGAVACESKICSEIGIDLLARGVSQKARVNLRG